MKGKQMTWNRSKKLDNYVVELEKSNRALKEKVDCLEQQISVDQTEKVRYVVLKITTKGDAVKVESLGRTSVAFLSKLVDTQGGIRGGSVGNITSDFNWDPNEAGLE